MRIERGGLMVVAIVALVGVAGAAQGRPTFSGITVFGDSLSDTGNVRLAIAQGTWPLSLRPEARPVNPWYTTGRWTNGRDNTGATTGALRTTQTQYEGVWHERLADRLGVPRARASRELGGTNYAYGGATTDDTRFSFNNMENLGAQVIGVTGPDGPLDASRLYVAWAGGNDIRNAALQTGATRESILAAATEAVASMRTNVERIAGDFEAGARGHILWPNLPALHLTPDFAGRPAAIRDAVRDASILFREAHASQVAAVRLAFPSVSLYSLDVYGFFNELIAGTNPEWNPVNKTGSVIRARTGLTPFTLTSGFDDLFFRPQAVSTERVNPDDFIFWDQLHPTSRAHSLLGDLAFAVVPTPGVMGMLLAVGVACARRRRG